VKYPKVSLYIRIRVSQRRYRFAPAVFNRNGTLWTGFASISGNPVSHPEGIYYLRFLRDGKRIWQMVGSEADAVLASVQNTEQDLREAALRRTSQSTGTPSPSGEPPQSSSQVLLAPAVDLYIERLKKLGRSFKTVREANRILDLFAGQFLIKTISEITSDDLISHIGFLRSRGLSERTISNHTIRITALLRKPEVEAYDADQLKVLFAAIDDEEKLLFEFFLGTGLREQEVMHCSWQNIDFKNKVVKVRSKPMAGFRIKDKQERSVPVPDRRDRRSRCIHLRQ
jgi:integrase/recombinase XerD